MGNEEEREIIEEEQLDEIDIDLADIEYDGHDLEYWEEYLTVKIPALPCSRQLMTSTLIELNNKFQIAYNCYNKLLVLTSKAERMFKQEVDKAVAQLLVEYQKKGVTKTPTTEKLELMVVGKSERIKTLYEMKEIYSIIREFFKNNKTKLDTVIASAKDISFSINQSDRNNQQDKGHGL